MSTSSVLADRDINSHIDANKMSAENGNVKDVKSMEYHRQVLQSKIEEQKAQQSYVSPSDTIMSPCTAKLSALRNKQVGKAKPKSLFAKTSAAKLNATSGGDNMFGGDLHKSVDGKN